MAIPSFTTGQVLTAAQQNTLASYAMPTGSVTAFAGSTAPTNFLLCDGTAVSRTTYAELFALISTTYGAGDGSTTFNVPNLKGRMPVGRDSTQTEFDALAETGGAKTVTLTTAELPSHTHVVMDTAGFFPVATDITFAAGATGFYNRGAGTSILRADPTGGGGAHNNLQPYLVLNYIIKT
jgi:microcystin-dependent protein